MHKDPSMGGIMMGWETNVKMSGVQRMSRGDQIKSVTREVEEYSLMWTCKSFSFFLKQIVIPFLTLTFWSRSKVQEIIWGWVKINSSTFNGVFIAIQTWPLANTNHWAFQKWNKWSNLALWWTTSPPPPPPAFILDLFLSRYYNTPTFCVGKTDTKLPIRKLSHGGREWLGTEARMRHGQAWVHSSATNKC